MAILYIVKLTTKANRETVRGFISFPYIVLTRNDICMDIKMATKPFPELIYYKRNEKHFFPVFLYSYGNTCVVVEKLEIT